MYVSLSQMVARIPFTVSGKKQPTNPKLLGFGLILELTLTQARLNLVFKVPVFPTGHNGAQEHLQVQVTTL